MRRKGRTPNLGVGNSVQGFQLVCDRLQRQEFRLYFRGKFERRRLFEFLRLVRLQGERRGHVGIKILRLQIERFEIFRLQIVGIQIQRLQIKFGKIVQREGQRPEKEVIRYRSSSFKYFRNFAPKLGFRSANSTVAFRNPSLSPASCVFPSCTCAHKDPFFARATSPSVSWISPTAPGLVFSKYSKISGGST